METLLVDDGLEQSDWTKQSWDLPPYKSKAFNGIVPNLEAFKHLPVYLQAVKAGLIKNDEWAGPTEAPGVQGRDQKQRGKHIHIHLGKAK